MPPATEAELKLSAADDATLDRLATIELLGPARLGPAHTILETDAYLDTEDQRLASARWACRLRSREGRRWISLKGPAAHRAGSLLHRRPEIDGPVGDPLLPHSWPASPARQRVLELAGDAPLRERLVLRQRRTERAALAGDARVATLSLDRVEVLAGGALVGRLRTVELELGDPPPDAAWLDGVARGLLAVSGLSPEPASKLELALGMLGREAAGG